MVRKPIAIAVLGLAAMSCHTIIEDPPVQKAPTGPAPIPVVVVPVPSPTPVPAPTATPGGGGTPTPAPQPTPNTQSCGLPPGTGSGNKVYVLGSVTPTYHTMDASADSGTVSVTFNIAVPLGTSAGTYQGTVVFTVQQKTPLP